MSRPSAAGAADEVQQLDATHGAHRHRDHGQERLEGARNEVRDKQQVERAGEMITVLIAVVPAREVGTPSASSASPDEYTPRIAAATSESR